MPPGPGRPKGTPSNPIQSADWWVRLPGETGPGTHLSFVVPVPRHIAGIVACYVLRRGELPRYSLLLPKPIDTVARPGRPRGKRDGTPRQYRITKPPRYNHEVVREVYERTGSLAKAAEELQCSHETVRTYLKQMGIPLTRARPKPPPPLPICARCQTAPTTSRIAKYCTACRSERVSERCQHFTDEEILAAVAQHPTMRAAGIAIGHPNIAGRMALIRKKQAKQGDQDGQTTGPGA
jgi:hypothetical protein